MLPEKDEVLIAVSLHEMDFVTLLRAARMLGITREAVIKQAVVNALIQMQRQGMDLGIQLPPEPKQEEPGETKPAKERTVEDRDGQKD